MSPPGGGNPDSEKDFQESSQGAHPALEFPRTNESGEITPKDVGDLVTKAVYDDQFKGFLIGMLGCKQDAEDVIQDVAYALLCECKFAVESRWSYFRTACRNRATDILRRRKHVAHPQPMPTSYDGQDRHPDINPEKRSMREEEGYLVRQTVGRLKAGQSEIVTSHLEGLTHEEIGVRHKILPGTVKSRLHAARKEMRDSLSHLNSDDLPPPPV